MSDILREWLVHQLGLALGSLHPDSVCSKFRNGVFVGKLLRNYDIVSSGDFSLLVDGQDEAAARSNFQHLRVWLKTIGVPLDDDTVDGLVRGTRSTVFGLLYKLCFFLEDPNNLHLIRYVQQLHKSFGSAEAVLLNVPGACENERARADDDDAERRRPVRLQYFPETAGPEESDGRQRVDTFYGRIDGFERSLPAKLDSWNTKGDRSCIRFLSDLKAQKQHAKAYDSWSRETANAYLRDSLNAKTRHNRNALRNKSMPDKLTSMSEYEKKMLDNVNNARLVAKDRDTIAVKNLVRFVNDTRDVDGSRGDALNERIESDIRGQEAESTERNDRAAETRDEVKTMVRDLIGLSAECGAYGKTNFRRVPGRLWNDWKEMFVRRRPLDSYAADDRLGLLLNDHSEFGAADDGGGGDDDERWKTHRALNRRDVSEYLKCVTSDRSPSCAQVLGFVVHDVFSSLYALPGSPVRGEDDNETSSAVRGILNFDLQNDGERREICDALVQREILPVVPATALQYCLCAYYRETDNADFAELLEDDCSADGERATTPAVRSTQTQTCRTKNDERVECGRNAFVHIYRGKPLPKHCVIDCVLCYIKENRAPAGWVIIGLAREEVMILEERLAKKHFPPFGTYGRLKNENPTILVPFVGPEFGHSGRYRTSLTGFLRIAASCENPCDVEWNDVYNYYRSQGVLTVLQDAAANDSLSDGGRKARLICDVLTGRVVDWDEQSHWVRCVHRVQLGQSKCDGEKSKVEIKTTNGGGGGGGGAGAFKRKRQRAESEFDFINNLSLSQSQMSRKLTISSGNEQAKVVEVKSQFFNVYVDNNAGAMLANFWKRFEREFVTNMESCFLRRRILLSEQEPYVVAMNRYLREILLTPNAEKIKLVRRLQADLFDIPTRVGATMTVADVTRQLSLAVSDATLVLLKWTNEKIEKCRQFIGGKNIELWLGRQVASAVKNYKSMLQIEVDRIVNTVLFINSYMSKLHSQELPMSAVPSKIEIASVDYGSRANVTSSSAHGVKGAGVEDNSRVYRATVKMVERKVTGMFSAILEWLDESKETQSAELAEKNTIYLKIWKFLLEVEKLRSVDQLKHILDAFLKDVKEMDDCFVQYRLDAVQRINDRLQYELSGVDVVCSLFETAIRERTAVRHEILFIDDRFYLNPENVLYPNSPPPQPFPLSVDDGGGGGGGDDDGSRVLTVDTLETIARQLATVCPKKRVQLVVFSDWLNNHVRRTEQPSFRTSNSELRALFGRAVNYIDWSDFVIHCLRLSYPDADDLLHLKRQYANLERTNENDYHEGTLDKDQYDSVPLWYQKTLPPNPAVHLRQLKIKDLLFAVFSDAGGRLDYVQMLLALCRDDRSTAGLMKAISLVTGRNVATGGETTREFFADALHNTLIICLKNYLAPDESDLRDLLISISNIRRCDIPRKRDTFSVAELIENKRFRSLAETGFRFKAAATTNN